MSAPPPWATRLPWEAAQTVNDALGLPRDGVVTLRTVWRNEGPGGPHGDAALCFFTAGGPVEVPIPQALVDQTDFDLWDWVLERLRERRRGRS
jgi:hypothetical protein